MILITLVQVQGRAEHRRHNILGLQFLLCNRDGNIEIIMIGLSKQGIRQLELLLFGRHLIYLQVAILQNIFIIKYVVLRQYKRYIR